MSAQQTSRNGKGGANHLDDYVDVAERIRLFYERFPEGRLDREKEPEYKELGGKTYIVYRAIAHRYPGDRQPGRGMAWEPFPGATPFTKESELMNAETAAWGRAIVATGIVSRRIASRQEVENRQPVEPERKLLNAEQLERLEKVIDDAGLSENLSMKLRSLGLEGLTEGEVDADQGVALYEWARAEGSAA